jgi:hypothetical protein
MRSKACVSVGVLTLVIAAVLSCGTDDPEDVKYAEGVCCLADPVPHRVTLMDCQDDADCGLGTACLDARDFDQDYPHANEPRTTLPNCRGTSQAGKIDGRVCGIPVNRTGNRQALTTGFKVPAFQLTEVVPEGREGVLSYSWKPPKGTEIVHCALFGCRPAVRVARNEVRGAVYEIANFDQCVLAHELFEPGSGVFDPTNPELEYHPTNVDKSGCFTAQERQLSELQVGCWAYDTTDIIAATPLRPIDPRNVFNYQGIFADCTSAGSDRKACVVEGTSRIGTCREAGCRDVCVQNRDCDQPDVRARFEKQNAAGGAGAMPLVYVPPICTKPDILDYVGFCKE